MIFQYRSCQGCSLGFNKCLKILQKCNMKFSFKDMWRFAFILLLFSLFYTGEYMYKIKKKSIQYLIDKCKKETNEQSRVAKYVKEKH